MFKVSTQYTPARGIVNLSSEYSIYIAIDVLRAGSTVCSALFNGAKKVIPAGSPEKAMSIASRFEEGTCILAGERNCQRINGFNLGNSPLEFTPRVVANKYVVLFTTNGTIIFTFGKRFRYSFVGAFVNLSAIVSKIVKIIESDRAVSDILLFCAGNEGNFSLEDFMCSGAIIESLKNKGIEFNADDTSRVARELFVLHSKELKEYLLGSEHSAKLIQLGFEDDVHFSLTLDRFSIVPSIIGTSIIVEN